jgi:hypothetical protein
MHPVEHKLKYVILPYLVSAELLKKWKPLQVYTFYLYSAETFTLLAGIGLANPIVAFLNGGNLTSSSNSSNSSQSIIQFLGSGYAATLSIILLIAWGILKFYVKNQQLDRRCSLLRSCIQQCAQFSIKVRSAINSDNPMPALISIQEKLSDLIERNIVENAWPYAGPAPKIEEIVDNYCDRLIAPFKDQWIVPPIQLPKT